LSHSIIDILDPMSAAGASPGRIVRWEILKGLPGEGSVPKHFHQGHPTPWMEVIVIRFFNEDGSSWVGNFQGHLYTHSDVALTDSDVRVPLSYVFATKQFETHPSWGATTFLPQLVAPL
jgi:hypothetical protein